ncbi:MAG: tetratricopeptide repeat protein [Desulfobacterales bacterium]|nr:MAG: tetratricopeptide repeat protein [Desulfobacterales bacterium]
MQAKRLLIEKLGTYLQTNTEVLNYQLTKDEITSFSGGIVKTDILEEFWDGKTYKLKAQIEVDPNSVAKKINELRKSGIEVEEIEQVNEKYINKIQELKQELIRTQSDFIQVTRDYNESSKILNAWDSYENGLQFTRTGRFEEAVSAFNIAIESNPKYMYFFHRGKAYMNLKRYEKAIEDFTTVINLNPNVADAYFHRGRSLRKSGSKKKGLLDIKTAGKLGSGNVKRWLKLNKK